MREIRVLCAENHTKYRSALQYMLEKELCGPAAGAQKMWLRNMPQARRRRRISR
jgi:hypothetical protein